jgi:hypothetical protein
MKKEIESMTKKAVSDIASKPISRKEAIKKTGYMAVSAATMMLLLSNPAQASGGRGNHNHSCVQSNDQKVDQAPKKGGSKDGGIWK